MANFYYMECMFKNSAPLQGIWLTIYGDEFHETSNANVLDDIEPRVYMLFFVLFLP